MRALLLEVVVPIGLIFCFLIYQFAKNQKRKSPIRVFPEIPVRARLQPRVQGTFALVGESIKFTPSTQQSKKQEKGDREIELGKIESITKDKNKIIIKHEEKTDTFVFRESQIDQVYAITNSAWVNKRTIIQKTASLPEQKKLTETFTLVTQTVDPLFDTLTGLHEEINWKNLSTYLTKCGEANENQSVNAEFSAALNLTGLSEAIANQEPQEVSKETQKVLECLFKAVSSLHSESSYFEEYHPNYKDLQTAVSAYYALNDVILGETVGDSDLSDEKQHLIQMLSKFSNETRQPAKLEVFEAALNNLDKSKVTSITQARTALIKVIVDILKPS